MSAPSVHPARAAVPTDTPGRYLAQLCKHFAHRIPTEYDPPTFEATRVPRPPVI